jgi:protein tyrosine/serine phosphatase
MKIFKRIIKYLFYTIILLSIIILFIREVAGNFYKIDNDVYRSGQLNKYNLKYYVNKYDIKTILNLRGESTKSYYLIEKEIAKQNNIDYITYEISNRTFLDFNKTSTIINIIKNSKKPLLIHCAGGADRTSLASALYQYAVKNESINKSKEQFSIKYGHSVYFRPYVKAMDDSFDNYVKKQKEKSEKNK